MFTLYITLHLHLHYITLHYNVCVCSSYVVCSSRLAGLLWLLLLQTGLAKEGLSVCYCAYLSLYCLHLSLPVVLGNNPHKMLSVMLLISLILI